MTVDPRNPQRITAGRLSMSPRPPGTGFYSGQVAGYRGSTEIPAPPRRGHSLRPLIDRPATHRSYPRVSALTSISRRSASACRPAFPPFRRSLIHTTILLPSDSSSSFLRLVITHSRVKRADIPFVRALFLLNRGFIPKPYSSGISPESWTLRATIKTRGKRTTSER